MFILACNRLCIIGHISFLLRTASLLIVAAFSLTIVDRFTIAGLLIPFYTSVTLYSRQSFCFGFTGWYALQSLYLLRLFSIGFSP